MSWIASVAAGTAAGQPAGAVAPEHPGAGAGPNGAGAGPSDGRRAQVLHHGGDGRVRRPRPGCRHRAGVSDNAAAAGAGAPSTRPPAAERQLAGRGGQLMVASGAEDGGISTTG